MTYSLHKKGALPLTKIDYGLIDDPYINYVTSPVINNNII